VRDVAEVKEAPGLRFGAVTRDGKEVVAGDGAGAHQRKRQERGRCGQGEAQAGATGAAQGVSIKPVYDRTELVDKAVKTAESALLEGSILVAIVLFLFLGEIRSAIVVVVTLPLAMLIAFILMQYVGMSANLMSLAGLAIGIGMMVDGAVVMVENGFRLLSHQAGRTVNRTHVMLEAAREVINPIAFAILIIIVVFLPLFSLTGLEGKMFKPMALTIAFAMVGSLVLTLTLVPVLSALILKPKEEKDTFLVRWAKRSICPCSTGRWTQEEGPRRGCRVAGGGARRLPVPRQGVHAELAGRLDHVPGDRYSVDLAGGKHRCVETFRRASEAEFPAGEIHAHHDRPRRKGRDRRCQLHGDC
jgi:cobalt-zinc-cadmium resistance protein CzcA